MEPGEDLPNAGEEKEFEVGWKERTTFGTLPS